MKYKRYPKYKDSGVEWLDEIPEHWKIHRLKYTVDLINLKVDASDSDLLYMGLEHIESWTGKRVNSEVEAVSEGQANLYKRGDVLFGKLRPYLAKVYAAEMDGICTGELLVLRPKYVKQKFLFNYILNPDFVSIINSSTYGVKIPRANWDFIGNISTLIPPIDEQKFISSFLDRETARIDVLIEKKERQIELLKEKRAALISHAVTKGLPAEAAVKAGLDPNVKMKDSGVEWLGEIPEHWVLTRLGYHSSVKARLGWKGLKAEEYIDEGYIFLSTPNIKENDIDFTNVNYISEERYFESPEIMLKVGDVLLVKDGSTLGIVNYLIELPAPATVNSSIAVLRPKDFLHSPFFYYLLKSKYIQNIIQCFKDGQGVPHLFQADIKKFYIWLPSLNEQLEIANHLDDNTNKLSVLLNKVQQSIELLKEYRTALISAAVTGKIDVREEVTQ